MLSIERPTCVRVVVHTGMTEMALTVLCTFHICTCFLCQGAAKELRDKHNVWMCVCVCVRCFWCEYFSFLVSYLCVKHNLKIRALNHNVP